MKRYYIYTLEDPRTEKVRYVGMTMNPARRLIQHLRDRGNPVKRRWLHELINDGEYPTLRILHSSKYKEVALRMEAHWIQRFLVRGDRLVNIAGAHILPALTDVELPKPHSQMPSRPLMEYVPREDHTFEGQTSNP